MPGGPGSRWGEFPTKTVGNSTIPRANRSRINSLTRRILDSGGGDLDQAVGRTRLGDALPAPIRICTASVLSRVTD